MDTLTKPTSHLVLFDAVFIPIVDFLCRLDDHNQPDFNWVLVSKQFYNYYKSEKFENLMKQKRNKIWKQIIDQCNRFYIPKIIQIMELLVKNNNYYLFKNIIKDEICIMINESTSDIKGSKWKDLLRITLHNLNQNNIELSSTKPKFIYELCQDKKWKSFLGYCNRYDVENYLSELALDKNETNKIDIRWLEHFSFIKLDDSVLKIHLNKALKSDDVEYFEYLLKSQFKKFKSWYDIMKDVNNIPFKIIEQLKQKWNKEEFIEIVSAFISRHKQTKTPKVHIDQVYNYFCPIAKEFIIKDIRDTKFIQQWLSNWSNHYKMEIKYWYFLDCCVDYFIKERHIDWFNQFIDGCCSGKDEKDLEFLDFLLEQLTNLKETYGLLFSYCIKRIKILRDLAIHNQRFV